MSDRLALGRLATLWGRLLSFSWPVAMQVSLGTSHAGCICEGALLFMWGQNGIGSSKWGCIGVGRAWDLFSVNISVHADGES